METVCYPTSLIFTSNKKDGEEDAMFVSIGPDYPVEHEHLDFRYYWPLHPACVRIFKEECESRVLGRKPGAKDRHVRYISNLPRADSFNSCLRSS